MAFPLRILSLEDDPHTAELIQATLTAEGFACGLVRVESREGFTAALDQGGFAVILADYTLPSFSGLEALAIARTRCPDTPFIFVSGTLGEEIAIESLKQGATDYVMKQRLSRLAPAVRRALEEVAERTARQRSEQALAEEARISSALAQVGRELIVSLDTPKILDRLCQLTVEVVGCDCSSTIFFQPEKHVYVVVASYEHGTEQREMLRPIKLSQKVVANVIEQLRERTVLEVEPGLHLTLAQNTLLRQFDVTAMLLLALQRGDVVIGFQTATYCGRTGFTLTQQRIAQGIAQLASFALENARLFEQAESANRLKSDFLATMSHELRTPIHISLGYTGMLLAGDLGPLTAEQTGALQTVEKSGQGLNELITSLLDVSQLEDGKMSVMVAPLDVAQFMAEVEAETSALVNSKSALTVTWQVSPVLPELYTDRVKLKIVLKNLLANALKFTDQGGITVEAQAGNGGVEFSVADTGIGISPETQCVMFDRLRQGDSTMTRQYGGVGLGLYIVKQLLELLGGTVTVESEVGKGATFRVQVPVAASAPSQLSS